MDTITVQWLEKLIKETACSGVEFSSGILQVIFDKRRLVIQSSWRLINNSEIVIASDSDSEHFEIANMLLNKMIVEKVSIDSAFNDLEIHFGAEVLIQSFADSEKYEHWYFTGGPEEMIVAGPGKLCSAFQPPKQ